MGSPFWLRLVGHDPNGLAQAPHRLVRSYFRRLAAFGLAVDGDFTGGDQVLALSAAVGDTAEFEQIAKRDVFVTQPEFQGVHAYAPRRRHR